MEVHEATAIGKANKCNIEDDEALAEVRKYPCLYPMFSFFLCKRDLRDLCHKTRASAATSKLASESLSILPVLSCFSH